MKYIIVISILLVNACTQNSNKKPSQEAPIPPEMTQTSIPVKNKIIESLTDANQLTFSEKKAKEGYSFSDGNEEIF